MADLAQQAAQSYPAATSPPPLAATAALANAVAAAPNVPTGDPNVPVPLPPAGVPVPPAQDSTIVVTPAPAPPPQVTVVPKPPGPPSAQPAGAGGPTPPGADLQALMANATSPADPNGDAVDQALAADATARSAPPPAKPGDMAASGAAATAAGQRESQALADTGTAEQQAQADETAARLKQAAETEKLAAQQKQIRDQAAAHVQQLREKAAKEPYHTLFEGQPGAMALAGIGILLGSANYSANHVNQAVGLIDRAIKQNFDAQQAKHAQLWKDVETAMEEGRRLRADQLDEMANFRARQAQTLDAVISKGKELAGRAKNAQMAAALDAKNAQLAFERDKAYSEVERLKAAQLEAERHNKAEESIGRAKVGIEAAKERRAAGADQEEKVYKLAAKAFPSYKDAQKSVKEANDVHDAIDRLRTNPSSLTSALELGGIVKLIEGRNSIAGLKMAKDSSGNVTSGFLDELSKALTGNQGAQRRQTLINELESIAATKDRAAAQYRKQAESATSRLRQHAPEAVDSYLTGIFGDQRTTPAGPPPGAVMGTLNGKRGYVLNGVFTAM